LVEIPAQSPPRAFQTLRALQATHRLLGTCFRAPNGPGLTPIRCSLTSGKASIAKAREEFESWESQNNKHEDLDADEQQKTEDGQPASILSWLVSNKHVDDVAQHLPAGSRHVAVGGSVDKRVKSLFLTAKANEGAAWCEDLWFLVKSRVPARPAVIKGFPKGTTREEADEVLKTLDGMGIGRLWEENWGCLCNETNTANVPTCLTCAARGGGACGVVKWIKSPETVKEDMVAQILRWHRQGKPAGAKPKPANPVHECDINSLSCKLSRGCDFCDSVSII